MSDQNFFKHPAMPFAECRYSENSGRHFKSHMHQTFSVGAIDRGEVIYHMGFLSAILNPKNAIFYLSLFTVMVSSETSLFVRGLYALWMTGIVLIWDLGVAGLLGNKKIKQCLGRWIFGIEKFSGLILALFGILLTVQ